MKTYSVTVVKTISLFAVIEVEAEDEIHAEEVVEDETDYTEFTKSEIITFEVEEINEPKN